MTGIVKVSASADISNNAHIECRIDATRNIEVTLGTWEGAIELLFERHALERFVDLANLALDEPPPVDAKTPPPSFASRPDEVELVDATQPNGDDDQAN